MQEIFYGFIDEYYEIITKATKELYQAITVLNTDFDDVTGYKIWLYPTETMDVLSTVFHEMTHIKQFFYGELDLNRFIPRWKGKKCEADYKDQPWEQEAHEMEVVLLKEFLDIQVDLVI